MVCSGENLCPIGVVIWLGFAAACPHPWHGLSQVVAAVDTSHSRGIDGSRVVTQRSVALSGATVATAADGLKTVPVEDHEVEQLTCAQRG